MSHIPSKYPQASTLQSRPSLVKDAKTILWLRDHGAAFTVNTEQPGDARLWLTMDWNALTDQRTEAMIGRLVEEGFFYNEGFPKNAHSPYPFPHGRKCCEQLVSSIADGDVPSCEVKVEKSFLLLLNTEKSAQFLQRFGRGLRDQSGIPLTFSEPELHMTGANLKGC